MCEKPGSRYRDGFVLASMDSRQEWGDTDLDYVIKRINVLTKVDRATEQLLLLVWVEVEVCSFESPSAVDDGFIDAGREVLSVPFPYQAGLRKQLLRNLNKDAAFALV